MMGYQTPKRPRFKNVLIPMMVMGQISALKEAFADISQAAQTFSHDEAVFKVRETPLLDLCQQLIIDNNSTEDYNTPNFYGWNSMVDFGSVEKDGSGSTCKIYDRDNWDSGASRQLEPISCLTEGSLWKIRFRARLYNEISNEGIHCDPSLDYYTDCPLVRLRIARTAGDVQNIIIRDNKMKWDSKGWNYFDSLVKISSDMVGDGIESIRSIFAGGPDGSVLMVDNVSWVRHDTYDTNNSLVRKSLDLQPPLDYPEDATPSKLERSLKNLIIPKVSNGDFDKNGLRGWKSFKSNHTLTSPGYRSSTTAQRIHDRHHWLSGIMQNKRLSDISQNVTLLVSFKAKLVDETTGEGIDCNPRKDDYTDCPLAWIRVIKKNSRREQFNTFVRDHNMRWEAEKWSNFDAKVTILVKEPFPVQLFRFTFAGGPPGSALIIDNIVWEETELDLNAQILDLSRATVSRLFSFRHGFTAVHGICAGPGMKEVLAYSSDDILAYTPYKPVAGKEYPACDDCDHRIQGTENIPCSGGTFLRPTVTEDVSPESKITMEFAYEERRYLDICLFVETGSRNGDVPWVLMRKGFTWYGTSFSNFTWHIDDSHACSGYTAFTVVCLSTEAIVRESLVSESTALWEEYENNMVSYGSAEFEMTVEANFEVLYGWWGGYGAGIRPWLYASGAFAFQVKGRLNWAMGMYQNLKIYYLSQSTTFRVSFRAKLHYEETGAAALCDPSNPDYTDCPLVWLRIIKSDKEQYNRILRDNRMQWNPDGWNRFESFISITTDERVDFENFRITFAGGDPGTVLLLDNIVFEKVDFIKDGVTSFHVSSTRESFSRSYPFVSFSLPVDTASEFVHGFCSGSGMIDASATTNYGPLTYSAVRSFAGQIPACDDCDYSISGLETTPCKDGFFLRPSVIQNIPLGTVAHIELIHTETENDDICVFVESGTKNARLFSTLNQMGFINYGNVFSNFNWFADPTKYDWAYNFTFNTFCLENDKALDGDILINPDAEDGTLTGWESYLSYLDLTVPGYDGSKFAFKIEDRTSFMSGMTQTLGLNHADVSQAWRVSFRARLLDRNGNGIDCDPSVEDYTDCPLIYLRIMKDTGGRLQTIVRDNDMIWDKTTYNTFDTHIKITDDMAENFQRIRPVIAGGPVGSTLLVDDVTWTITTPQPTSMPSGIPSVLPSMSMIPTIDPCQDLVEDGDVESGALSPVWDATSSGISVITPGYASDYAIKITNRERWRSGIIRTIKHLTCLSTGSTYRISFKARLIDQFTGAGIGCDPSPEDYTNCPLVLIRSAEDSGQQHELYLRDNGMQWNPNDWSTFNAHMVMISEFSDNLKYLKLFIMGGMSGADLILDDISMTVTTAMPTSVPTVTRTAPPTRSHSPTANMCSDLIAKGDAESGTDARWRPIAGRVDVFSPGYASNYAYRAWNRKKLPLSGLSTNLAHVDECITEGSLWKVTFRAKLYDGSTGQGINCNPQTQDYIDCPFIRLRFTKQTRKRYNVIMRDNEMYWDANAYNEFSQYITIDNKMARDGIGSISLDILGGMEGSELLVDDVKWTWITTDFPTDAPSTSSPSDSPTTSSPTTLFPTDSPSLSVEPTNDKCVGIVPHGDAESGTISHLTTFKSSIGVSSPGFGGSKYAFKSYNRERWKSGPSITLQPEYCLVDGSFWEVSFKTRLLDKFGRGINCDPSETEYQDCPLARLQIKKDDDTYEVILRDNLMSWSPVTWNTFHTYLTLTPEMVNGTKSFSVTFSGGPIGATLLLDDIKFDRLKTQFPSSSPTDAPTLSPTSSINPTNNFCANLLSYGDAETGTDTGWKNSQCNIGITSPGYDNSKYAFRLYNRKRWKSGIFAQLGPLDCLANGTFWHVSFEATLLDDSGEGINCDPVLEEYTDCPLVILNIRKDGENSELILRDHNMNWSPNGYSTFNGYLTITDEMTIGVNSINVLIAGGPSESILLLDNISWTTSTEFPSMTPTTTPTMAPTNLPTVLPTDVPTVLPTTAPSYLPTESPTRTACTEMISDGDADDGDLSEWDLFGASDLSVHMTGHAGSKYAYKVAGRTAWTSGMKKSITPVACFQEGRVWQLTYKARIFDDDTGKAVRCQMSNPEYTDCPLIWLQTIDYLDDSYNAILRDTDMSMDSDGWMRFKTDLTITTSMIGGGLTSFTLNFAGGPPGSTLLLDEISMQLTTAFPTSMPSVIPTLTPTDMPSWLPTTFHPTSEPTVLPTELPTVLPSLNPSMDPCRHMIPNGDIENGEEDAALWDFIQSRLTVASPGYESNYALRSRRRKRWFSGPQFTLLPLSCMPLDTMFHISFKIKATADCNPQETNSGCPLIILDVVKNSGQRKQFYIRDKNIVWERDSWNTFQSYFPITPDIIDNTISIKATFAGITGGEEMYLDDIVWIKTTQMPSLSPTDFPTFVPSVLPTNEPSYSPSDSPSADPCDKMIRDGGAEDGLISNKWKGLSCEIGIHSPGVDGSLYAYKAYNRWNWDGGIVRSITPTHCLTNSTYWHVTFKVKLFDETTGEGVDCNPTDESYTDCPLVWLRIAQQGGKRLDMLLRDHDMTWDPNGWNTFLSHVTITSDMADPDIETFDAVFAGGKAGSVLLVDDVSWYTTTDLPTMAPSASPTGSPTVTPTTLPTVSPSSSPSTPHPSPSPSLLPTSSPTSAHSGVPTAIPSSLPTSSPTTSYPTVAHSVSPSETPTSTPSTSPTVDSCLDMMRGLDAEPGDLSKVEAFVGEVGLSSPGYGGSQYAYKVYDRWTKTSGAEIDVAPVKCLTEGTTWVVSFRVKLEDATTGDGVTCDPRSEESTGCPYVWLRIVKKSGEVIDLAVRDSDMSWNPSGWNSFKGHIGMTGDLASNIKSAHSIFTGGPLGSVLLLDDISWTPTTAIPTVSPTSTPTSSPSSEPTASPTASPTDVPSVSPSAAHSAMPTITGSASPSVYHSVLPTMTLSQSPSSEPCEDMMRDENAESGELEGWKSLGGQMSLSSPGYGASEYAYKAFDRWSWNSGMEHDLGPLRCLEEGSTWAVTFKARLEDEGSGEVLDCDSSVEEYTECPLVWLRGIKRSGERFDLTLRDNGMSMVDGWYSFRSHLTITSEMLGSGLKALQPVFAGGATGSVLYLDDVSWIPTTSIPTGKPSDIPTVTPTAVPTSSPSDLPTLSPSYKPSSKHSVNPTSIPTDTPSANPTVQPSASPTLAHSVNPSVTHSDLPSSSPTDTPSANPTVVHSASPTLAHSVNPSVTHSDLPSSSPTVTASANPTVVHSASPTLAHSVNPSVTHSDLPSSSPTVTASEIPTAHNSASPTRIPPSPRPTTARPTPAVSLSPSAKESEDTSEP